jgi:hypothetical protein
MERSYATGKWKCNRNQRKPKAACILAIQAVDTGAYIVSALCPNVPHTYFDIQYGDS